MHAGLIADGPPRVPPVPWTDASTRASLCDETKGVRALEALLEGHLDAAAALEDGCGRYLVGFFARVGLLTPSVSMRVAWRLVCRLLKRSST